jgi:hypothetical protein
MVTLQPTQTEPASDARWFVLHTRSRQELILSNELRSMGLSHTLLLVDRLRRFGACEAAVRVPLFPQCVFLRGTPLDAQFATRTTRVTGLDEVTDGSRLGRELANVGRAINAGVPCEVVPLPAASATARVKRGPLAGVAGYLDRDPTGCRILLPLTCLGQSVAVTVDPACVEIRDA